MYLIGATFYLACGSFLIRNAFNIDFTMLRFLELNLLFLLVRRT